VTQVSKVDKKNLPLIRLSAVNPFLIELKRRKVDASVLLREMSLPVQVPASGELFVAATTMYTLVERTAEIAEDPYLGYTIGRALNLEDWEPISRSASEAATVGELLSRFVVNALEHSSGSRFFLQTEGEQSTFGFRRAAASPVLPAQNDAFYLGLMSRLLMGATAGRWDPELVLFKVADPTAVPSTDDRLRIAKGDEKGIRVIFPTRWSFAPLPKTLLTAPLRTSDVDAPPSSLLGALHVALSPHLHEHNLTVERAASICGYATRRLSRQLREQGTTLAREIASLRARRAQTALLESDRPIREIAESVGFHDPSVFSRAFKKWTGQSPQKYRQTHRSSIA
jgi:AraC-like DNA-binding protein